MNLGSGEEIAIAELARRIAELFGYRGRIAFDTSRPNGQPCRRLDVSRARERLGFTATTPLAEGLRRTVDYFRAHRVKLLAQPGTP
jgi:GDP-L-fucose synthase